jgi:hypothetical protein
MHGLSGGLAHRIGLKKLGSRAILSGLQPLHRHFDLPSPNRLLLVPLLREFKEDGILEDS